MAVVSTSMASPVTTPNSVVSTQFSALHCSCLKLDTTLSTQSSSFQHADSHSRLSSSRHGSRGVVSMAASGKIFIGGNWKCAVTRIQGLEVAASYKEILQNIFITARNCHLCGNSSYNCWWSHHSSFKKNKRI